MSLAGIFALAVSLSMDSFAAALGRGANSGLRGITSMARSAATFAVFEVAALSAGWAIGFAAVAVVEAVDHWIAFVILAVIGGRMIYDGFTRNGRPAARAPTAARRISLRLVGTALATSIDAGAVGITMVVLGYSYVTVATVLGAVVFTLSCIGLALGRHVGPALGRRAEIAGGLLLIAVGTRILIEHLYF